MTQKFLCISNFELCCTTMGSKAGNRGCSLFVCTSENGMLKCTEELWMQDLVSTRTTEK